MVESYNYYNIFSPEGKLLQVEYALESLNSAIPMAVCHNDEIIICASKKPYHSNLHDEIPKRFFKISKNIYALITGIEADIDQVIFNIKNLLSNQEYKMGIEITPDILCRLVADKAQILMQETGERMYAFSLCLFGFDNGKPMIYYTDSSAVMYPYKAVGMGEKCPKINKFLEKVRVESMNNDELLIMCVRGLLNAIGEEAGPNEMDVFIVGKDIPVVQLTDQEKDNLLQRIADI